MTRLLLTAALIAAVGTAAARPDNEAPFEPKLALKIQGHTAAVTAVAYSPDGKLLATASGDKTVRIWDAKTGDRAQRLPNQESAYCVAFSPDGKRVAVGSFGGAINVFDVETGDKMRGLKTDNSVALIRWSPTGKSLATVAVEAQKVVMLDADTGNEICTMAGHTEYVNNLTFSPDGKRLATVSRDATARLWDAATGQETDSLKAHDGNVHAVAFSADGKTLLTGGNDNTIVRWNVATGNIVRPVMEIPTEKNGGVVAIGDLPGGRVWGRTRHGGHAVFAPASAKLLSRKPSFDGIVFYSPGISYPANDAALNPDGKTFAVVDGNDVLVWDASREFGTDQPAAPKK